MLFLILSFCCCCVLHPRLLSVYTIEIMGITTKPTTTTAATEKERIPDKETHTKQTKLSSFYRGANYILYRKHTQRPKWVNSFLRAIDYKKNRAHLFHWTKTPGVSYITQTTCTQTGAHTLRKMFKKYSRSSCAAVPRRNFFIVELCSKKKKVFFFLAGFL